MHGRPDLEGVPKHLRSSLQGGQACSHTSRVLFLEAQGPRGLEGGGFVFVMISQHFSLPLIIWLTNVFVFHEQQKWFKYAELRCRLLAAGGVQTYVILGMWPEAQFCLGPAPSWFHTSPLRQTAGPLTPALIVSELREGRPLHGNIMHVPVLQQLTGNTCNPEVKSTVPSARQLGE